MTNLFDIFSQEDFASGLREGLINVNESDVAPGLFVLNYSKAAPYTEGAWDNAAVLNSRGIVVDSSNTVISRAWKKFFNWNQYDWCNMSLSDAVEVTDKMDGSLGIAVPISDGSVRISTRGSMQSEMAMHATEVWKDKYFHISLPDNYTLLFEIVYSGTRVVVDYGNFDDLVLLGAVEISSGKSIGPVEAQQMVGWSGPVTEVFEFDTFKDALEFSQLVRPNSEGVVVRRLSDGFMLKFKQEDYIRLHRLVTGLSPRRIWHTMFHDKKSKIEILSAFPDEFQSEVEAIIDSIVKEKDDFINRAFTQYVPLMHITDRKTFAQSLTKEHDSSAMFMLFDNNLEALYSFALRKAEPKSTN